MSNIYYNFNPIIVLFLTNYCKLRKIQLWWYFNPIIVLFLTDTDIKFIRFNEGFQSYYSLISNSLLSSFITSCVFQSYYSLISNTAPAIKINTL